jgi:hypothetical protein
MAFNNSLFIKDLHAALHHAAQLSGYLIAMGFTGDPTARVIGSGGAQKKNSYT